MLLKREETNPIVYDRKRTASESYTYITLYLIYSNFTHLCRRSSSVSIVLVEFSLRDRSWRARDNLHLDDRLPERRAENRRGEGARGDTLDEEWGNRRVRSKTMEILESAQYDDRSRNETK